MENIEETVIRHSEQLKTLFNRTDNLDQLLQTINALAMSVKEIAIGLSQVKENVGELQDDVETIKAKPAKKWEDVSSKVLWAILAAVIGLVLGKFGL